MKLIKLSVLCKPLDEDSVGSYKSVLSELNIEGNDDESSYYWCDTWYNLKVLEDELFHFYARNSDKTNTVLEFFDGRSTIVDIDFNELQILLER